MINSTGGGGLPNAGGRLCGQIRDAVWERSRVTIHCQQAGSPWGGLWGGGRQGVGTVASVQSLRARVGSGPKPGGGAAPALLPASL